MMLKALAYIGFLFLAAIACMAWEGDFTKKESVAEREKPGYHLDAVNRVECYTWKDSISCVRY